MHIMNKSDILKTLNEFAIDQNEKPVIELMNLLIQDKSINEFKELFFKFISATQFYGYIEYLNQEQKNDFLNLDLYRSSSYQGINIEYYNRGQLSLLNEMEDNQKLFISAPTSFGKTSLIIDLIVENNKQFKNILMILPTNSLIEELFLKFNKVNHKHALNYHISTQPKFLARTNNLLILTPEKYLVLAEEKNMNIFNLIIMDEAYKIVDFDNKTISDFINRRSYRFRKVADMIAQSEAKVLYLSPYTYKMNSSMNDFLNKYSINHITRRIDYVSHEIIRLVYATDFTNIFGLGNYKTSCSIKEKVNLILNALGNEKSIVYVGKYSSAYGIVDSSKKEFICSNERYILFLEHMKENYTIPGTPTWKVVEGLEKGIGIYISPLPRYIKKEIVYLYERGLLRTLIVTTAFTEGINTDAEHLIITTLVAGPNKNKLTELDLLNTIGRAGRFAKESIGKIYCINKKIYTKAIQVKKNEEIELFNDNYVKKITGLRNDYELDMIDDNYLNENEIERRKQVHNKMKQLDLTLNDLDISLNVSNAWKLQLYEKLSTLETKDIGQIVDIIKHLVSDEGKRVKAIEFIFRFIKNNIGEIDNPFPQEIYEISPFDAKEGFIWGRMYGLYASYSTKILIQKNMEYIMNRINHVKKVIGDEVSYSLFELVMKSNNEGWICRYIKKDFSLRYDRFYTEAFKFISSIVQYKIPYYISFFVSIFRLFLARNNIYMDFVEEIDLNNIVSIFENNSSRDEYAKLIDFGISKDILMKLSENEIRLNQLKFVDDFEFLDNYEKLMIKDILNYL